MSRPLVALARRVVLVVAALSVALSTPDLASGAELQRCVTPRGSHTAPSFAPGHPRVLLSNAATLSCLQSLLGQGAPSATRFKAWVDEEVDRAGEPGYVIGEPSAYAFEGWYAALLYRVTGEARYADFAVAFADHLVAAEEARIAGGENASVSFDSYLYVGDTIGDIALVYDWCADRIAPAQKTRWVAYMNQAVANVWDPAGATWGGRPAPWTGWSVDNPSNNYYYSFLRATMLLGLATRGENPRADEWIAKFRTAKIGAQLVPTFLHDLVGGGSREGTGYGTAMRKLFELYDWWERSTGERIADLTPHAEASLQWMTHAITPTLDRIVPIGDHPRDSEAWLFDYHREYLLVLMSLYAGTRPAAVADRLLADSSLPRMGSGFQLVWDYLYEPAAQPSVDLAEYGRSSYSAGSGLLTARSRWNDPAATFASLVCGPYTESHAHMEQGAFQLFRREWLATTGTRHSHSGLAATPDMKNLVRFRTLAGDLVPQQNGEQACTVRALRDAGDYVYASVDATGAYGDVSAIDMVQREFLFIRPSTLVVFDRMRTTSEVVPIWTLNLQRAPSSIQGDHLTYLGSEHAADRMDVDRVAPAGRSYAVSPMDWAAWGDTALDPSDPSRRVDVVGAAGTTNRFLHVLGASVDGQPATSEVTADNAPGMTGVRFRLADGRQVTARFANDVPGGTLELSAGASGAPIIGDLPTDVAVPAAFSSPEPATGGPTAPAGPTGGSGGGIDTGNGGAPPAPSPTPTPTPTPNALPSTTRPAGGATPANDPWALAPRRAGGRLVIADLRVRPIRAQRCPSRASLVVARGTRTVLRRTVRVASAAELCRVRTARVVLPARTTGALRVSIRGTGIRARSWQVR